MLNHQLINVYNVISIFRKYCHYNNELITRSLFEDNLAEKQQHRDFLTDISILLSQDSNWDVDKAFEMVTKKIISIMD